MVKSGLPSRLRNKTLQRQGCMGCTQGAAAEGGVGIVIMLSSHYIYKSGTIEGQNPTSSWVAGVEEASHLALKVMQKGKR